MMSASRPISGSQAFKDGVLLGIDVGTYDGEVVVVVGADDRHRDEVLEAARPEDPGVEYLLVGRSGRVVPPEGLESLGRSSPVASQEVVPREQGADRSARGAAQAHHLVPFQLLH